jgi:AcrR family transcriptional regulator
LGEQHSSPKVRPYTMRARQESVEQTRRAIVQATMVLHERVGPAATTVSAIADEAGVTRLTVYRHFPDDAALVMACSGHWRALHPRPDAGEWSLIEDPVERLRRALSETYAWHETAAPMMTRIYHDLDTMPAFVAEFLAADAQSRVAILAKGFHARGRAARRLTAALHHAVHLRTWESLCVAGGLEDDEVVELMIATVLGALATPRGPRQLGIDDQVTR